jgi:NAD(P)-dependent dehydrogenase (short-subunit alcohol dehydrogenase family)
MKTAIVTGASRGLGLALARALAERRWRLVLDARGAEELDAARAELERVDRGESTADRWQLEQRIIHAENQLTVVGRG